MHDKRNSFGCIRPIPVSAPVDLGTLETAKKCTPRAGGGHDETEIRAAQNEADAFFNEFRYQGFVVDTAQPDMLAMLLQIGRAHV